MIFGPPGLIPEALRRSRRMLLISKGKKYSKASACLEQTLPASQIFSRPSHSAAKQFRIPINTISDIADIKIIQEKSKLQESPGPFRFETSHKAVPSIAFDLRGEESAGTVQLFIMLFFLLDMARNGKTFMLDEFDLSLHTKLADFVIDLFHARSTAQFMFTSHNTNLIDVKRFRRDQIVFVNKKDDGSTELYSLYDHKDFRENMDAEKGYLQGRFDAIPLIDSSPPALKKLLENGETA